MNAIAARNAHALRAPAASPAPPIGAAPARYGNGRVEVQVYPAASAEDRIAAAVTLLAGLPFRIVPEESTR